MACFSLNSGYGRLGLKHVNPRFCPVPKVIRCSSTTTEDTSSQGKQKIDYELKVSPKPLSVPSGALLDVLTASLPLVTRLGSGAITCGYSPSLGAQEEGQYTLGAVSGQALKESSKIQEFRRPQLPLQLYEFESCPYCKKVREIVSYLDLDVEVYPCPKEGQRYRTFVVEDGGKALFPYLIDPNTTKKMYESDDIVRYLCEEYGDGQVPFILKLPGNLTTTTAGLGAMARSQKGRNTSPSKAPEQPLIFYGYEASPFVKIAREKLCEMEIPYLYRNVARGSPKRQELFEKWGKFAVPYLEDPNTKIALFESVEIVKYLQETYGV